MIMSSNSIDQNNEKKIWSFDALVEAMKPSDRELEYRKNKHNLTDALQDYSKFFKCTVCQKSFENILKKHEKVPVHPCLGVLMCKKCCNYYEDGEFSLDSDGEDKYCRWCGQGGTIFGCSKCICGFCVKCIKFQFAKTFYKQVEKDDNWLCFFCNPEPLWHHRFICSLAVEISESQGKLSNSPNLNKHDKEKSKPGFSFNDSDKSCSVKNLICESKPREKSSKKRIYSSSSDESENEIKDSLQKKVKLSDSFQTLLEKEGNDPTENLRSNVLKELDRILKLTENQMNFGINWTSKMLKNLTDADCKISHDKLVNKCQGIKSFLSVFSTYLIHISNCADSLEKILLKNNEQNLDHPNNEKSPYTTILQFLGFVNNQVKTFRDKGISLSDILEAEVYDDNNIIGIKKKLNSSNQDKNTCPNKIETCFGSDDYDDSENKVDTEEPKFDDEDRSRDESSLEIMLNTSTEMNFKDSEDEYKDFISSNVTSLAINSKVNSVEINSQMEAKGDIQEILAILENA